MHRRVTVLVLCVYGLSVGLFVGLSVTTLVPTSLVSTLKIGVRIFLVFNSWIFDNTFRSEVMV